MDLYVVFPGSTLRLLVDVTVRSPHASRYPQSAHVIGTAARAGAEEKVALYGSEVLPVPFESYGRLGVEGHNALAALAFAAGSRTAFGGHSKLQHGLRRACELALLYATADVALLALGAGFSTRALDCL